METTQAYIVDRYIQGDNEALAELYVQLKSRLLLLAYNRCHDKELSRDLVQDVFERMLQLPVARRQEYFGGLHGNLEAYLSVAVKNKCIDARKVRNNRENILASIRSVFAGNAQSRSFENFSKDALQEMLNSLQPREQQIIRLHLEGYNNEEIAAQLQLTYNSVKNNIYEARVKIKKMWRVFMM